MESRAEQFPKPVARPARPGEFDPKVKVNGVMMTRMEWKHYMEDCPHEHYTHPGVYLMDSTEMSICDRCKRIQHTVIAKMEEGGEF